MAAKPYKRSRLPDTSSDRVFAKLAFLRNLKNSTLPRDQNDLSIGFYNSFQLLEILLQYMPLLFGFLSSWSDPFKNAGGEGSVPPLVISWLVKYSGVRTCPMGLICWTCRDGRNYVPICCVCVPNESLQLSESCGFLRLAFRQTDPNPTADKLGDEFVLLAKCDNFGDLGFYFLCDLLLCFHGLTFLLSSMLIFINNCPPNASGWEGSCFYGERNEIKFSIDKFFRVANRSGKEIIDNDFFPAFRRSGISV